MFLVVTLWERVPIVVIWFKRAACIGMPCILVTLVALVSVKTLPASIQMRNLCRRKSWVTTLTARLIWKILVLPLSSALFVVTTKLTTWCCRLLSGHNLSSLTLVSFATFVKGGTLLYVTSHYNLGGP